MEEEQLNMNGEEFVEIFYVDQDTFDNLSLIENSDTIANVAKGARNVEDTEIEIPNETTKRRASNDVGVANKSKRRANLTEFQDDLPVKRKNEAAKRELTSVLTQLGKIDKQLNTSNDKSRVTINFVATFTSFKSNRVNTFKYPLDAEVTKTFLEYDATMTAVKNAVKEAMSGLTKEMKRSECEAVSVESPSADDSSMTPTKTISAFTALPSPVSIKGQPVSSKNLCAKNSCTFGKRLRKHVWIKCCHQSVEGESCSYWVHASCLGFPTLKEEDAKLLDGWHCPDHVEIQLKRK